MKNTFTCILFLVFVVLKLQGQDYFISFSGSGAATQVGTVEVTNQNSGTTVTLNGGDLLHLIPALGINPINNQETPVQIFPNPTFDGSAVIRFITSETGKVVVNLIDISGKIVSQSDMMLKRGEHDFEISALHRGFYFLSISSPGHSAIAKLISNTEMQGATRIEHLHSNANASATNLKNSHATVDMPYSNGNILLYKGMAGEYRSVVTDVPTSNHTITFPFVSCKDHDGNTYATVQIGTLKSGVQTWMAENLNVGVRIQDIFQTNNNVIEKNCYENMDANCNVYGGLYTRGEALQYTGLEGAQGICPGGWHIPSKDEWSELTTWTSLGPEEFAGGKMKEAGIIHWKSPNTGATNESGFTGLPAGLKTPNVYGYMGESGHFWSSTEIPPINAWSWGLVYSNSSFGFTGTIEQGWAFSIRCIKN